MVLTAKFSWQKITALAVLAGIIYDSWPLGYWLNPVVGLHGLASNLEAINQPFNWLFVSSDIASSLLVICLAFLIWRQLRRRLQTGFYQLALLNVGLFGAGTIIDALLPLDCNPTFGSCPNFAHDHLLLLHGVFSIAASLCLFTAMLLFWWQDRRSRLLVAILMAYAVFGLVSLLEALHPVQNNWSQHYYITLCSICLAGLPYMTLRHPIQTNRAQLAHQVKSLRGA